MQHQLAIFLLPQFHDHVTAQVSNAAEAAWFRPLCWLWWRFTTLTDVIWLPDFGSRPFAWSSSRGSPEWSQERVGKRARKAARHGATQPTVCSCRHRRPLWPIKPSPGIPEIPIEPQAGFSEVPIQPQAAPAGPEDARRNTRVHHGPREATSIIGDSPDGRWSSSGSCSCLVQFLQVNCYI